MEKLNHPALKELIDQLSSDVRVIKTQNKYEFKILKKELQTLSVSVNQVIGTQAEFSQRFLKMDEQAKYNRSWLHLLMNNWWKILMILIPVMVGLGELMVYLRNLSVN